MGRLEGHDGTGIITKRGEQTTPLTAPAGEETQVRELPRGERRYGKRRRHGGGAGNWPDIEPRLDGCRHQVQAGVADHRRAALRDEGDVTVLQRSQKAGNPRFLVVLVVADETGADGVACQELAGCAGVLGGDERDFAQDA